MLYDIIIMYTSEKRFIFIRIIVKKTTIIRIYVKNITHDISL